jgi:LmbE family N-acetylglucosaminyl deacetylase
MGVLAAGVLGADSAVSADAEQRLARPARLAGRVAFLQVVAHPDDDLYFMNPDIADSVRTGGEVTTVVLTAAEAGGGARFAAARQHGLRSAYARMAGAEEDDPWRTTALVTRGGEACLSELRANPQVRLVFLDISMGGYWGTRPGDENYTPLAALYRGTQKTRPVLRPEEDPVSGGVYTRDQLVGTLTDLMDRFTPTVVRTLDPDPERRIGPAERAWATDSGVHTDNEDHTATAWFTYAAYADHRARRGPSEVTLDAYIGYGNARWKHNLGRHSEGEKLKLLGVYGWADRRHCGDPVGCGDNTVGGNAARPGWSQSTSLRHPGTTDWLRPDATGRLRAFAVVGGQAVVWRETAPGSGRYAAAVSVEGGSASGQASDAAFTSASVAASGAATRAATSAATSAAVALAATAAAVAPPAGAAVGLASATSAPLTPAAPNPPARRVDPNTATSLAPHLSVAVDGAGRAHLAGLRTITDPDGGTWSQEVVVTSERPDGTFQPWTSLGAPVGPKTNDSHAVGSPEAVVDGRGVLHVFVRNADMSVSWRHRDLASTAALSGAVPASAWSDWQDIGGERVRDGLTATVTPTGDVELHANGQAFWSWRIGGDGVPQVIPTTLPPLGDPPTVRALSDGVTLMAARQPDTGELTIRARRRGLAWEPAPTSLGSTAGFGVMALQPHGDGVFLAQRGRHGLVETVWQPHLDRRDGVRRWLSGPGPIQRPSLAADARGLVVVAAVGPDGALYTARIDADDLPETLEWHSWPLAAAA